jgi:hypothetical protein
VEDLPERPEEGKKNMPQVKRTLDHMYLREREEP